MQIRRCKGSSRRQIRLSDRTGDQKSDLRSVPGKGHGHERCLVCEVAGDVENHVGRLAGVRDERGADHGLVVRRVGQKRNRHAVSYGLAACEVNRGEGRSRVGVRGSLSRLDREGLAALSSRRAASPSGPQTRRLSGHPWRGAGPASSAGRRCPASRRELPARSFGRRRSSRRPVRRSGPAP